jgi:oxygen-independent coproporphyrinogen-3 oxidase
MDLVSAYIHLPFCKTRCPYCDFCSSVVTTVPLGRYADSLAAEYQYRSFFSPSFKLVTAYLGGGTPSLLSGVEAARLLGMLPLEDAEEVTAEVNPGDTAPEWFSEMRAAGVSRFSIGVQALDDARLGFLGRRHRSAAARQAIAAARGCGARSVSADVIYGTPGQTPASLGQELTELAALGVDHVSCYELTVAAGTPLGRRVARGEVALPSEEEMVQLWQTAGEVLGSHGFERYEVSSYARPGHRCRHNERYWTGGGYIGLGLGAHGFVRDREGRRIRYANLGSLESYFDAASRLPAGTTDVLGLGSDGFAERISELHHARERMMLGLRTAKGVLLREVASALPSAEQIRWEAIARRLETLEMARIIKGYLVPTEEGLLNADALAEEFF